MPRKTNKEQGTVPGEEKNLTIWQPNVMCDFGENKIGKVVLSFCFCFCF
jgi:hypothetical protein